MMTDPADGTADVIVLGDGAVGCTIAVELRRRDPALRVVLVGPGGRPGGASQAAGAMLGAYGEVTDRTVRSAAGRVKFSLALQARSAWPEHLVSLAEAAGVDTPALLVEGTYVVLNGKSGHLDSHNFDAMMALAEADGEPVVHVGHVPGLDPAPDARPLRAVHFPNEHGVNAREVLYHLDLAVRRLGVSVVHGSAASILRRGERAAGVALVDGTQIAAPIIVAALGAWTTPVFSASGILTDVQPVLSGSGVAYAARRLMGPGFAHVVRTVNRAGACGLHVVPLPNDRDYFGATNVVFHDPELDPHLGVCHFVMDSVMSQLDQMACYSRIEEVRIGNRPLPLDTYPLLGPTALDGVICTTGTYRDGFSTAPVIAALTADLVLEGVDRFPIELAPMRRPYPFGTVSESIEEFVLHAVSSAFEGGTHLSHFLTDRDLAEPYRQRAETFYRRMGDKPLALAPELLNYALMTHESEKYVDELLAVVSKVALR